MPKIEADLLSTITAFTRVGDLKNLTFLDHSERVTYISLCLGKLLNLTQAELEELTQSALLHDIGITADAEQLKLAELEPGIDGIAAHCHRGYKLLESTKLFGAYAHNVLEHHDHFSPQLSIIPAIIHVADRVDVRVDKNLYAYAQADDVFAYFQKRSNSRFHPEVVDALHTLANTPSFWLDLEYDQYKLSCVEHDFKRVLTIDELEEIATIMAKLVDARSSFTGDHSEGVASVAHFLATKLNFSNTKARMIRIAGLLHDIGKLAIPDEILMHPGALNKDQRAIMKQHTYHSYHLIRSIGRGAERIAGWAAFHHERLNGTGYPFTLSAPELECEARLMAVADLTQSLLEHRPYRSGMSTAKVTEILHNNVQSGHIDSSHADLAIAHLDEISELVQSHESVEDNEKSRAYYPAAN